MDENENFQSQQPTKKYRIIKPSFYIDDERRVVCESHSQIERILTLSSLSNLPAFQETQQVEKLLTCKTCKHYQNDVCFFPKEEIDRIEKDRLAKIFHCKLCGGSIDRPLTIMYSLYNKEKYNVQIPTVCCTCFSTLDKDTYMSDTRRRIIIYSISFIVSIALFFSYAFTLLSSTAWGIFLFVVVLAFWAYMGVRDIKNIIFLLKGQKYYKKTYGQAKQREKGKYVDDFPFD
ncbi:MAG: hypothetical protein ACTSRD_01930 [Promethearchaeota archaeon]